MKYSTIIIIVFTIVATIMGACKPNNATETRNLEYEAYCDSIWENDVNYYLDVLVEEDEYQEYIELNGQWWD